MGIQDRFGESGQPDELLDHFGLNADHLANQALQVIKIKKKD